MSFDKAEQLIELARLAASRQGLTLNDVVEHYGVSLRTAQRMFRAMENIFPDTEHFIDEAGRKRWRMASGHMREFFSITAEEAAALELGCHHLVRSGLTLESKALQNLRNKVIALVPSQHMTRIKPDSDAILEAQGFVARPGPRPRVNEDVALIVAESIKACRLLDMTYRSHLDAEPMVRRVAPYGLLSGARRYLVALDPQSGRQAIKIYRMDAIRDARLTHEYFQRPADFDLQSFANRGFGLFQNDGEYGEVEWCFAPEAAEHVRGTLFHPEQEEDECPDGSIIIRFKAAGLLEMAWYLYQWGDKVDVRKPERLREMVMGYRRSDFAALP